VSQHSTTAGIEAAPAGARARRIWSTDTTIRIFVGAYIALFFAYLFGPLIIMSITAFNSSSFPRVVPWECFTFEWFGKAAADHRLRMGLSNSAIIGAGVVALSVTLGLAGALFLTQVWPRARATYYTLVISPILMPGVVLGISTLLFWDRMAKMLGASSDGIFYNGIFLTILGQSCFIASYCMLVFIARLQRFDMGLMDAALDLGASNAQAFRKILLPFLKPAVGSAAVLAFLASFENYNTTVFTISHYNTFTTEVGQKARLGIDPSISSLAVVIIGLSLVGVLAHEGWRRYAARRLETGARGPGAFFSGNPAAIMSALIIVAGLGTLWAAQHHSAAACKAEVLQQKLDIQRAIQERAAKRRLERQQQSPGVNAPAKPGAQSPGRGNFGDAFSPDLLRGAPEAPAPAPAVPTPQPGRSNFGDAFSPNTLKPEPGQQ
jgi:spermidine/putrescine transport system permease protein